jgi:hypothetical protein
MLCNAVSRMEVTPSVDKRLAPATPRTPCEESAPPSSKKSREDDVIIISQTEFSALKNARRAALVAFARKHGINTTGNMTEIMERVKMSVQVDPTTMKKKKAGKATEKEPIPPNGKGPNQRSALLIADAVANVKNL